MKLIVQELALLAARLPPSDRLQLVEAILATLDKPDPEISAAWAAEAEDRLAAYRREELAAVDERDVFDDLEPADESNTATWLGVARRRLDDLDFGRAEAISGDHVFERVRARCYAKTLAARIAAADRGEFASDEEIARFFAELGK